MDKYFSLDISHAGTSEAELRDVCTRLQPYVFQLKQGIERMDWTIPETSLLLPSFEETVRSVENVLAVLRPEDLKLVIVVGIGGSNLGTEAVYRALPKLPNQPRLLFADTVSPTMLLAISEELSRLSSKKQVVINVISKSGNTTETIANFEYIYHVLAEKFGTVDDRVVVTTDEGSSLFQEAKQHRWHLLTMPKQVGGRYSVFSAVGLFPLMAAHVMPQPLLASAAHMRERCLQEDWQQNPALLSAAVRYLSYKSDRSIQNAFFFNPELESLGKWWRQLLAESIGKKTDVSGQEVRTGIVPVVSIGSTDLHSMAQLYFGGPNNMLTTFVYHAQTEFSVSVPRERTLPKLVDGLSGKRHADIMTAIFEATKIAYKENDLPFIEISLGVLREGSLGAYLQWSMMETMYLAQLLHVNAFDQPSVEEYKRHLRERLS